MGALHLISTGKQTKETLIAKICDVHTYCDAIHLREKEWRTADYLEVITNLRAAGVPARKIIVNGSAEIAHAAGAGGVQLTSTSMPVAEVKGRYPQLRIGRSVHQVAEAVDSERAGADYVIFGHVFQTASKPGIVPRGLQKLQQVVHQVSIPVIAIGGVRPHHVADVLAAGAGGIAVLSGVFLSEAPVKTVKEYQGAMEEGSSNGHSN